MITGVMEAGVALALGVIGGVYIIGQMNAHEERNKEDIETIKKMIKDSQESMKSMMTTNILDMRALLDTNKEHQKENLEREINHLKDLIHISGTETREDIKRLEARQAEANHIKERLALAESSLKSLHRRLDIDPPPLITKENQAIR